MQYEINIALGGMSVRTMRVLIVEDEYLHMEIMKKLLKKLGFDKITACEDGKSALSQAAQQKFDLVFTDGNMPGMDGIELVERLHRMFRQSDYNAPVIMITGNRETDYVLRAGQAGVNQFIGKPFNIQTLRERIEAAFEERKPVIRPDRDIVTQPVKPS